MCAEKGLSEKGFFFFKTLALQQLSSLACFTVTVHTLVTQRNCARKMRTFSLLHLFVWNIFVRNQGRHTLVVLKPNRTADPKHSAGFDASHILDPLTLSCPPLAGVHQRGDEAFQRQSD